MDWVEVFHCTSWLMLSSGQVEYDLTCLKIFLLGLFQRENEPTRTVENFHAWLVKLRFT